MVGTLHDSHHECMNYSCFGQKHLINVFSVKKTKAKWSVTWMIAVFGQVEDTGDLSNLCEEITTQPKCLKHINI